VIAVVDALDARTAEQIAADVRALPRQRVVIDLTAIPAFDSNGAGRLFELQEELGSKRVAIVGMRQAATRMLGDSAGEPPRPETALIGAWRVQRSHDVAIVAPASPAALVDSTLGAALRAALRYDTAIVVLDLDFLTVHEPSLVDAIETASVSAADSGQELVVKARPVAARILRMASLGATTYVAEEPVPAEAMPSPRRPPYRPPSPRSS